MESSFTRVSTLDNEELRKLAKEIKKISNADAPANVKQSDLMKELFALEKTDWNHWGDRFSMVRLAIETEIIFRFTNDKL
jgi:hypothetical protein